MRNTRPRVPKVHFRIAPVFAKEVSRAGIRRAVQAAFEGAGTGRGGQLTVVVTDDARVRELNRTYRGVDASTDVLAFSDSDVAEAFVTPPESAAYFGDVVVSYPRAVDQAAAYGHSTGDELLILVVHGVLHLLGYDHEEVDDREAMWRVQSAALLELGIHWQP